MGEVSHGEIFNRWELCACFPLASITNWTIPVENVGNGVGPLHRKVDRNPEAFRGTKVLKDLPSGRMRSPCRGSS